ncbi:uncharacterized protein BJ171DRAFT_444090 [Polychytrium aggregatum]|uniref:uncharacterized protein n=1 Tax=Polychytrium aggregatum TaxID=110093 RepID=UPI0022FDD900|nr:uncharacterized protein BJ171DRAFT_444090 [Polychytrium aggregatum]KAI9202896.1 hypothetical protein BJ171DRAFT_444090 [Polychytrium aggregatum]
MKLTSIASSLAVLAFIPASLANFAGDFQSLVSSGKLKKINGTSYYAGLAGDLRGSVTNTVLPYGPDKRQAVADEVSKLFDIWVNRQSKIDHYGSDPLAVLGDIVGNARTTDDLSFHLSISRLFLSIRDLHTNYYLPPPYACNRAFLPWGFQFVDGPDYWQPTLAVAGFINAGFPLSQFYTPEVRAAVANVKLGHTLVSINGLEFGERYFEDPHNYQTYGAAGANDQGGMQRYAAKLSAFNGRSGPLPLPEEDNLKLVFADENGRQYTVSVPYIQRVDGGCIAPLLQSNGLQAEESSLLSDPVPPPKKLPPQMYDPTNDEYRELFPDNYIPYTPTGEGTVLYSKYTNNGANVGVIRITSFQATTGDDGAIQTIRNLLVNEFKDTDGLIIDLRSNGGGSITYADSLPQLFKYGWVPYSARALVSKTNTNLFNSASISERDWTAPYNAGLAAGNKYSDLHPFDLPKDVNTIGVAYLKPVAILNDAKCFSACELTSANFQDFEIATIFGEDGQTGGGGANVVEHTANLVPWSAGSQNASLAFKLLPYSDYPNPSYQPNMRVGWRELIRSGPNAGKSVEDDGVASDETPIRPTVKDVLTANVSSQFDRIASYLKGQGEQTGRNKLYFNSEPFYFERKAGESIDISGVVGGFRTLTAELDGTNQTSSVAGTSAKSNFTVKITPPAQLGFYTVTIKGVSDYWGTDDAPALVTKRLVRLTPALSSYLTLPDNYTFDYDLNKPYLALYNRHNSPEHGWYIKDSRLVVGHPYVDNVQSTLSFFVNLNAAKKYTVQLEISYDTEPNYDFVYLKSVNAAGDSTTFGQWTGNSGGFVNVSGAVPADAKEIQLVFFSDGGVDASGVEVKSLKIVAA